MKLTLNEVTLEVAEGITVAQLAHLRKPDADLLILNGFPVSGATPLSEGDALFLIKRGEAPTREELEATMMARHTPGVHARLKEASVGIAGVGGLGSVVAVALARIGVGRLVLADFDLVEPSNLNRQQYFIDQIGMLKVTALTENLARINPYITVEPHQVMLDQDNLATVFNDCPIIVEAFDRPEMKAMLVDTVLTRMPQSCVIAASGLAGFGSNNTVTTSRLNRRLYLVGDGVSAAAPGNGLMAPRVGIAACHQANQVLRIILGEEEP